MRDKLARLYPLHVLAVVLSIVVAILSWGGAVSVKILLAHLTLTSSWIPDPAFYIGANPVAWFVCDLFFLYLMAPIVVRMLGRLAPLWQVVLMTVLLLLEFAGGYIANAHSGSDFLNIYVPYQFPPIRLLDFATGVAIYNVGHTLAWQRLQERLTPWSGTIAEVVALLLFLVLYKVGKDVIHTHCYRAYCASAPAIVVLFTTFVMTSSRQGLISRFLSIKPLAALSSVNAEIYLMQYCVFFFIKYLCKPLGLTEQLLPYFLIQMTGLILTAWLIHRCYVLPLAMRLRAPRST